VEFLDLPLEASRGGAPDPDRARELLQGLLARDPWRHLGDADALRSFLDRAAWLRAARPDRGVPELGDQAVAAAAGDLCVGRTDLAGLRGADVLQVLRAGLPAAVRTAIDREAPPTLALPSGRSARIDYAAPAGPTVSAAIQELFGQRRTPTLGGDGGVPVVLELLAPNRRAVQITRDLASFWQNVYPTARIELGRRYPKHAWPEDPLAATPSAGPKRRRR
jgi:ATP-dependent helicase HrpB